MAQMNTLSIDIETYSDIDLKKCSDFRCFARFFVSSFDIDFGEINGFPMLIRIFAKYGEIQEQ